MLWQGYTQLTQIEKGFKNLKIDLKIRSIYHLHEPRMAVHILVAFIAYCLTATLQYANPPTCAGAYRPGGAGTVWRQFR